MLAIRRLVIHRFRNVIPETELRFGPGINVLLGKNASGKTTLLELLAAVLGNQHASLLSEPYEVTVELAGHLGSAVVKVDRQEISAHQERNGRAARYRSRLDIDVEFENYGRVHATGDTPGEIEVSCPGMEGVRGKLGVAWDVGVAEAAGTLLLISTALRDKSPSLEQQLIALGSELRSSSASRPRFDESLELFEQIVGGPRRQQDACVEIWTDEAKSLVSFVPTLTPPVVANRAWRQPDAQHIVVEAHQLDVLQQAAMLLGFAGARMELSVIERQSAPKRVKFGDYRFVFRRSNGDEVSHSRLSYGQKRLLAFLYYCHLDLPAPIVADELVNGMHHEWIEACLALCRVGQAFLTSQNPLLLDYLEFESAEQVRESFVRCSRREGPEGDQLVWESFTEEQAAGFYKAYGANVQHVSEILRMNGLW